MCFLVGLCLPTKEALPTAGGLGVGALRLRGLKRARQRLVPDKTGNRMSEVGTEMLEFLTTVGAI